MCKEELNERSSSRRERSLPLGEGTHLQHFPQVQVLLMRELRYLLNLRISRESRGVFSVSPPDVVPADNLGDIGGVLDRGVELGTGEEEPDAPEGMGGLDFLRSSIAS